MAFFEPLLLQLEREQGAGIGEAVGVAAGGKKKKGKKSGWVITSRMDHYQMSQKTHNCPLIFEGEKVGQISSMMDGLIQLHRTMPIGNHLM